LQGVGHAAEDGDGGAVTVSRESDDQTVADQLIVAAALDKSEILDASGVKRRAEGGKKQKAEQEKAEGLKG
jgi:hypothetical protein